MYKSNENLENEKRDFWKRIMYHAYALRCRSFGPCCSSCVPPPSSTTTTSSVAMKQTRGSDADAEEKWRWMVARGVHQRIHRHRKSVCSFRQPDQLTIASSAFNQKLLNFLRTCVLKNLERSVDLWSPLVFPYLPSPPALGFSLCIALLWQSCVPEA